MKVSWKEEITYSKEIELTQEEFDSIREVGAVIDGVERDVFAEIETDLILELREEKREYLQESIFIRDIENPEFHYSY